MTKLKKLMTPKKWWSPMTDSEPTQLGLFEVAEESDDARAEAEAEAESESEPEPEPESADTSADTATPTPPTTDTDEYRGRNHPEAQPTNTTASDGTELVNISSYGRSGVRPIDRSTRFGNQYKLKKDGGDYTREESIAEYREWFAQKLRDDDFREAVEDLRGETLGCWCKPKACHGEVIVEYLQGDWNPVDKHYRRDGISEVYETLGVIDDIDSYAIGNHDFGGWYQDRHGKARPWILSKEWPTLRDRIDRVLYATISYAPGEFHMDSWAAFEWDDGSRDFYYETPTPDYSDITAIAPFADIDLSDDVKHERPSGNIPKDKIEAALSQYIDAFAELAGGREHVYALDSVGGAYIFIAPSSTAPIATTFSQEERRLIFDDMMDKLNAWLGDVRDDVVSTIPETEGTFAPDKLNNKNRLFKAPLSIHSSLDGVVTPIDPADPSYDFTPITAVDADLIDTTTRWADNFTSDHTAAISAIVATLWPDAADGADSWKDALASVVARLKEAEVKTQSIPVDDAGNGDNNDINRPNPSEVDTTSNKQVVFDAIEDIDAEDVVRDLCDVWNPTNRDPPRFGPGYRGSDSDTSCFVGQGKDEGKIVDLDDSVKAIDVVTYTAREYRIIGENDTATGSDWWEAVDELRDLGYHIPRFVGDDDISDYYSYPITETARSNSFGDPFEDDFALLRTCLKLRDDYDELSTAKPPYAALVAIANVFDLLMADTEEGILGDSGYRYAREIYTELTLDNLSDELSD